MRIVTLNANGIRSAARKGFFEWLEAQDADVVCVQETKAQVDQLADPVFRPQGYHCYYRDAEKKGYSGVALYSRVEPQAVVTGFGSREFDAEGRYLEAQFKGLSVVSVYLPSGSSSEERQQAKFRFLDQFLPHLRDLKRRRRDYVLCGDWNIAHKEIDLKNWRSNQKNSGFLPEERAWLDELFGDVGYVDGFREVDQRPEQYTWWSNRGQAWAKNVGWRIDYQVLSPGLRGSVQRRRHLQGAALLRPRAAHARPRPVSDANTPAAPDAAAPRKPWWRGWLEALAAYKHPRVLAMLFLGFSAGLPFMLVFSTLSAWLREVGIERATIGMLSWVGIIYSIKFFWAPVVDRLPLPLLHRLLGRRRSWMLLGAGRHRGGPVQHGAPQSGRAPRRDGGARAARGVLLGHAGHRHRRVAHRGRAAADAGRDGGGLPARLSHRDHGRQRGRAVDRGGLRLDGGVHGHGRDGGRRHRHDAGHPPSPSRASSGRPSRRSSASSTGWSARRTGRTSLRQAGSWFVGAVVCPFVDFFTRYGTRLAVLMLAFIASYRLTDFTMGVMANPFYLDVGYTLKEIAAVAKAVRRGDRPSSACCWAASRWRGSARCARW